MLWDKIGLGVHVNVAKLNLSGLDEYSLRIDIFEHLKTTKTRWGYGTIFAENF